MKRDKMTVTVDGPRGRTVRTYTDMDEALGDKQAWSSEYARQWAAMPWWYRLWSRVYWWRGWGDRAARRKLARAMGGDTDGRR